ncbi:MAG TPA: hypothetical protein VFR90_01710 [Methylibium sp.]|uniref:hypothetical protein n=1 Tax=Methylibium sp. TaxID=2067992 RepID=UPI002DB5BE00|nr:hypothetical protein [Methylibium sp.]HEU4457820.1 hypothetical protein [Methylibium sp.]
MNVFRFRGAARVAGTAALVVAMAGCAAYGPGGLGPGSTVDQAIASMGQPTGRYPLAGGGQRLEFARGPMGFHTYMLDFDANGALLRSEQVLTEGNFLELQIGMSRDEVLRRIGHPSEVSYLSRQQHQLWSYRYETPFCIWYQVSIDASGKVAELGNNVDPRCERNDRGFGWMGR